MPNKYQFPINQVLSSIIGLFVFIGTYWLIGVHSVAAATVTYPIADLGYCRDAKECYLYCEVPQNQPACWSYGKYVIGEQVLGESDSTEDERMNAEMAEKGITFPILELGNCASAKACFEYCGQPQNRNACGDFAKKRNLIEPQAGEFEPQEKQALLEKAKSNLGCNSEESCRALCENNKDKCIAFMKQHGPERMKAKYGEYSQMMDKAKLELGCTSMETCKKLCDGPEGTNRCKKFSDQYAPTEYRQQQQEFIQTAKERLGCASHESCKTFCDNPENSDKCATFVRQDISKPMPIIGCTTETQCKAICEQTPDKCPGFTEGEQKYEKYERYGKYEKQPGETGSYPTAQPYQEKPASFTLPSDYKPPTYQEDKPYYSPSPSPTTDTSP